MQLNHSDFRAESLDKTTIKVNPNLSTLTRGSGQNYCQKGPKTFRLSPGVLDKPSSKEIPNCSDSPLRVWTKLPSRVNPNRSDSHPRVWTKSLSKGTQNVQTLNRGSGQTIIKKEPKHSDSRLRVWKMITKKESQYLLLFCLVKQTFSLSNRQHDQEKTGHIKASFIPFILFLFYIHTCTLFSFVIFLFLLSFKLSQLYHTICI